MGYAKVGVGSIDFIFTDWYGFEYSIMFTLELVNAIYIWFTKLNLLQTFGLSLLISLLSPRKIGLKKPQTTNNYNKEYDDVNEKLEEVLQNLSSQFRA